MPNTRDVKKQRQESEDRLTRVEEKVDLALEALTVIGRILDEMTKSKVSEEDTVPTPKPAPPVKSTTTKK